MLRVIGFAVASSWGCVDGERDPKRARVILEGSVDDAHMRMFMCAWASEDRMVFHTECICDGMENSILAIAEEHYRWAYVGVETIRFLRDFAMYNSARTRFQLLEIE